MEYDRLSELELYSRTNALSDVRESCIDLTMHNSKFEVLITLF